MTGRNFATADPVDFLVIGAGAAGGVIAKELSAAGFRVVVLEQGPYLRARDFSHDEIKYVFRPGLTNDPKVQPVTYRKSETEPAQLRKAIEYGRQVGGGSVHFMANYWRFHESDFHERSLYGGVSGADLADWPISYADLEPYYNARFDYYPASFALNGLPPDAPRWGLGYKQMFEMYFTRTMTLLAHTTSLSAAKNTITLDPDVKDAWGLPAIRVTYDFHPDDTATVKWMLKKQIEILEAAGAQKTWTQSYDIASMMPSRHLMGTCRMGKNPDSSVVNASSQTHDIPNLFLVDGSNFVTSARQQPTATIQALAYRAADHAIRAARRGEL
jgi:choline dehydrogenase-like flavoprotein